MIEKLTHDQAAGTTFTDRLDMEINGLSAPLEAVPCAVVTDPTLDLGGTTYVEDPINRAERDVWLEPMPLPSVLPPVDPFTPDLNRPVF